MKQFYGEHLFREDELENIPKGIVETLQKQGAGLDNYGKMLYAIRVVNALEKFIATIIDNDDNQSKKYKETIKELLIFRLAGHNTEYNPFGDKG